MRKPGETGNEHGRLAAEVALQAIQPWDAVEADHRADALAWVRSGQDIWRTAAPATPPEHLVSYFLLVDPSARRCLLVDHRKAQLWLPTGGHVDPGEDPASTVARECREELGIDAPLLDGLTSNPLFVTRTTTRGTDAGHVDVSLWHVCRAEAATPLEPDLDEFREVRWWTFDELSRLDPAGFDPHFPRFLAKLSAERI
jgi:8-oxo-dGTP diphosphatase